VQDELDEVEVTTNLRAWSNVRVNPGAWVLTGAVPSHGDMVDSNARPHCAKDWRATR
jgi:hypothetical protein